MPAMPGVGDGEQADLVKNKLHYHVGMPAHDLHQEPGATNDDGKQKKQQDIRKSQVEQRR